MVASEPNAHQAGDQEHITIIEDSYRVVRFLVGSYFIAIMNIRIPHAIKIWSCLFTLKNILKLRRSSSFSWNIFSIEMEQQMYVIYHSQNTASDQLPQPTRSQTGKSEENELRPQSHLVSLSGELLYCSGPGHSQQGVLSAHCTGQPLISPLITCS